MQEAQEKSGIARLLEIAGKRKLLLVLSAVLAVIHAALSLVPYMLIYSVIAAFTVQPLDISGIEATLLWTALAGAGSYLLLYISGMASHLAAFNILYELRKQTAEKLGRLPLGFIGTYSSGALKKIVSDDIERIELFIAHQIPDFVKGIALPFATITYLFYIDWRLASISMVPLLILLVFVPISYSTAYTKEMIRKYHQAREDMNSGIVEFVRAMPVMKIFGQTADSFQKYSGTVDEHFDMVSKWIRKSSPPWAVFMSFMSNAILPVLILGMFLYLNGGVTLSTLILFLILGVGYIKPAFALSNAGMQITLINRGVERMDEILRHAEQAQHGQTTTLEQHDIIFDHVSFSYIKGFEVLSEVSFSIPQGSLTAFVGPSGSGKSTAAQLIARFWDIEKGEIRIGGKSIRALPIDQLLQHVSYVFQDSFMFQETLYENIRMGMNKTKDEIVSAACAAQCHEFIMKLPNGYQTRFGESGTQLSGGERQRIQLARAILKNAPILILDEATAFSDPENEYLIQKAFGKLIEGKTVIVIAHRLSTITEADQIVVFDRGRVAAKGTHTQLLTESPLYTHMWNAHTRAKEFAI